MRQGADWFEGPAARRHPEQEYATPQGAFGPKLGPILQKQAKEEGLAGAERGLPGGGAAKRKPLEIQGFPAVARVRWDEACSCGEWIRTTDLQVMSLASCHCSTPRLVRAATDVGYSPAWERLFIFIQGRSTPVLVFFVAGPMLSDFPARGRGRTYPCGQSGGVSAWRTTSASTSGWV